MSITADGQEFVTCGPYSYVMTAVLANTAIRQPSRVTPKTISSAAKGVKKLSIEELPTTVSAPIPSVLPEIWCRDAESPNKAEKQAGFAYPAELLWKFGGTGPKMLSEHVAGVN